MNQVTGTGSATSLRATDMERTAPPPGGRAAANVKPKAGGFSSSSAETYLAISVVAVVALLVVPLPPFLLDAFLAMSFALSLVVLLVTLSTRDPLEFNVFPSLLLLITLLRLGLNVSSTRLILSQGRAGQVIEAFGSFVIGGNAVVGIVIFLILVVVNFVVITKGAGRIAEVAARFTLDAMPGRQMSIDADLGAGLIDEREARQRREEINRYADFFGSMDGAAKFVRGDAIAGLVITAINLVGGFAIGVWQRGLGPQDALATYSALTVGDGLVTQIPALIVSTSAGFLVTYGTGGTAIAPSVANQITRSPRALWTAAGLLATLSVVPGLPLLPFLLLAGLAGSLASMAGRRNAARIKESAPTEDATADGAEPDALPMREILALEPLELEIGYGLVPLADKVQNGDLLQRIGLLRKQLAFEIGVVIPAVRIRDNIRLASNEYSVMIRGSRVAHGDLMPRALLAIDMTASASPMEGVETRDPSFGLRAVWVQPGQRTEAEARGYTVVEPPTVLATHLMETIRQHAGDLLSRQDTRRVLDGLKETHPALVEDVVPNKVSLGLVHRVLQRLLREGIPVRDMVTILETLSDASELTKDPEALTEHVRRSLSSVIVQSLNGNDEAIGAITVGPRLEVALMQMFSPRSQDGGRMLEPLELSKALESLRNIAESTRRDGQIAPLVTPQGLRLGIRRLIEPILPRMPVVSLAELPVNTPIHNLHTWELTHAA